MVTWAKTKTAKQRREAKARMYKNMLRRKRQWDKLKFTLSVEYAGYPQHDLERLVERVVKPGKRGGSGYAFFDDTRDVSFGFAHRGSAIAAAKRLKRLRRGLKVEVTGQVWP